MNSFNSILRNIQFITSIIPNKNDVDFKNVISYLLKDLRAVSNPNNEYQREIIDIISTFIS